MQHIVVVNLVCLPRYILEHDTTPLQMYLITLHTTLRKKRSLHRSSLTAIFWVLLQGQYCDVSSHLSLLHAHCSHSFRGQRAAARWRMCCCRGSSRSSLRTSGGKNAVSANYQQSARDSPMIMISCLNKNQNYSTGKRTTSEKKYSRLQCLKI